MTSINLLPWREERRQAKRKEFFTTIGGVLVFGLLSLVVWDRWVTSEINWQNGRNDLLKREIAVLEKTVKEINQLKLRKQQMIDRMEVIISLQGNRPDIVKIYDEFVTATPTGVYFVEMRRRGNNISLRGYAESNSRISTLMRQLEVAKMFKNPNLTKVQADVNLGEQGSYFELHVGVVVAPSTGGA